MLKYLISMVFLMVSVIFAPTMAYAAGYQSEFTQAYEMPAYKSDLISIADTRVIVTERTAAAASSCRNCHLSALKAVYIFKGPGKYVKTYSASLQSPKHLRRHRSTG